MPEIPPFPQTSQQDNKPQAEGTRPYNNSQPSNGSPFTPGGGRPPYPSPVRPAKRPMSLGYKLVLMGLITLGLMIPDLIIYYMSSDRDVKDTNGFLDV